MGAKNNKNNTIHSTYVINNRYFIWYSQDTEIDKTNFLKFKKYFPNEQIHIYDNLLEIFNCLEKLKNPNLIIMLIISGTYVKNETKLLINSNLIQYTFILSYENIEHNLAEEFSKIKIITSKFDELLMILTEQIEISKQESLSNRISSDMICDLDRKTSFYFDSQNACINFIYLELIFKLFKSNKFKNSQKDFIDCCKENYLKYNGNMNDLKELISDIENGKISTNVIQWYTRQSFFYPMINNIFRKDDFYELFKLRFIINVFQEKLELKNYSSEIHKYPKVLYRGTVIHKKEFSIFSKNIGRPILLRGFVSTSDKKEVAEKFIKNKHSDFINLLLVIHINLEKGDHLRIYSISDISHFKQENEFLLKYDTFIKYLEITNKEEDLFEVQCTLTDFEESKVYFNKATLRYKDNLNEILQCEYNHDNFYISEIFLSMREDKLAKTTIDQIEESEETIFEKTFLYGRYYEGVGDHDKALEYFQKGLKIIRDSDNKLLEEHRCFNSIGLMFYYKGKYDDAYEFFIKSLDIIIKKYGPNNVISAIILSNIGLVMGKKENYDAALKLFQKASELIILTYGENHPKNAKAYLNIATCLLQLKRKEDAEFYHKRALNILLCTKGENHFETVLCYKQINEYYINNGEYDKAFEFIKSLSNKTTNESLASSICCEQLGDYYDNLGNYSLALEYYKRSLNINLSIYSNNEIIADSYKNIAKVFWRRQEPQAFDYFNICINLYESEWQSGNMEVINSLSFCYRMLSSIYRAKKNLDEAINYNQKAIDISLKKPQGESYSDLAMSYNNMSLIYDAKGDIIKGYECLKNALKYTILEKGENHPLTFDIYLNLASNLAERGIVDEALNYCENVLQNCLKIYGESHPKLMDIYEVMGNIYQQKNNNDEALKYFNKCVDINFKTNQGNNNYLTKQYMHIGKIFLMKNDYKNSLEFLKKSYDLNKLIGKNNLETIFLLGFQHGIIGEIERAIEYYEEGIKLNNPGGKESNDIFSQIYMGLSKAYFKKGSYKKALEMCQNSIDILITQCGDSSPELIPLYSIYANSLFKLKDYENSLNYHQISLEIDLNSQKVYFKSIYLMILEVYFEIQNYENVIDSGEKCLSLVDSQEEDEVIASIYFKVGKAYIEIIEQDKAIPFLEKAFKIYLKKLGYNNNITLVCCEEIGDAYLNILEFEKSILYYQEVITNLFDKKEDQNNRISKLYSKIGLVYETQGDKIKALNSYIKALNLNKTSLEDDSEEVQNLKITISNLKNSIDK